MDVIWCLYHRALTLFQKDFCFPARNCLVYSEKWSDIPKTRNISVLRFSKYSLFPFWIENILKDQKFLWSQVLPGSCCACTHITLTLAKIKPMLFTVYPFCLLLRLFDRIFWKKNTEIGPISNFPLDLLFIFCLQAEDPSRALVGGVKLCSKQQRIDPQEGRCMTSQVHGGRFGKG